jgi:hypothetical protein
LRLFRSDAKVFQKVRGFFKTFKEKWRLFFSKVRHFEQF